MHDMDDYISSSGLPEYSTEIGKMMLFIIRSYSNVDQERWNAAFNAMREMVQVTDEMTEDLDA
jgi:hypothetical protein